MFNDPEWATKEEWDAYAWFGFAIQEAQYIELMLLIIAVALDMQLDMQKRSRDADGELWRSLFKDLGSWTLGKLFYRIKEHIPFPINIEQDLKNAIATRNELAHCFFWTKKQDAKDITPEDAKAKLMSAASLFSNLSPALENMMESLIQKLDVKRSDAETKVKSLLESIQAENG
jgi:hypothetical protein